MSQKFIKQQNTNSRSSACGKYFAKAVYDKNFIGTKALAEYIQSQASVKRSDIIAVLDELGAAMKHFFEMGQKVKLDGIGIFKVGFSSIGAVKPEDVGAQNITTRRVLFSPSTGGVREGLIMKKETLKWIVQIIASIATALLTALRTTSCVGAC